MVWQGITSGGNPDPSIPHLDHNAVIVNTGLLVFREGLEAILVIAAITASMMGTNQSYRRPIAAGAGLGLIATVITWFIAIAVISAVSAPALDIQAATGLLAIVVLLVIMNWFFHKIYWTGWISMHNKRKRSLMASAKNEDHSSTTLGLALLGFSAMYREGFEVVLFLQNLRLQVGSATVLQGVAVGLFFTAIVAVLTFFAHQKLPYKKMLVLTGVLLGIVLVVMVGESAQELQLAHWISTTTLPIPIPDWMGIWFAVFPTVESLAAQAFAALFVVGSYFLAEYIRVWRPRMRGARPAQRPESVPGAELLTPMSATVSAPAQEGN
ncbi:iron permease [Ktedonosporobacter rubrisoli]|uniref:Iron permease n=1 Tax=Ktedonosporobacter rubrisoli TaxID=2509675 RepID=A0A4P6K6F6_KTERU|nr:iron permease [Ktedonosporobacter rubrisoli]